MPLIRYHLFKRTTGTAVMITDDKAGAKLPKHPQGAWGYSRNVNLGRSNGGNIGTSADQVIDAIKKDGYFEWRQPKPARGKA